MEDHAGLTLAGKYRLVHQLGKGGMGSVWLAQHLTLNSPVAIKLIDPQIATDPEAAARFHREARAAAALRSPHVVQILDHGVDGATPYIVMELLEGESLADRLRRLGPLPPAEAARVLSHVGRAVSRAHEVKVVHRDLKPDNVFLVDNEDEEIAKVLDFGIAKTTLPGMGGSAVAQTRTGAMMGTLHYMSPEQAEGARSLDFRTDIWAMGVIAFECLLGRRPFEEQTVGGLVLAICSRPLPIPSQHGSVPAGFDAWFARACARDPAARFPSAREASADLRRICETAPAPAAAPGHVKTRAFGQRPAAEAGNDLTEPARALAPAPTPAASPGPAPEQLSPGRPSAARRLALPVLGVAALVGGVIAFLGHRAAAPIPAPATPTAPTPASPPPAPIAAPAHAAAIERNDPDPPAAPSEPARPPHEVTPPAPSTKPARHHATRSGPRPAPPPAAAPAPPSKPKVNLGI